MINVRSTIAFLCAALIMVACNNKPSANESAAPKTFTSKNTDSFNIAFDSVLINYDGLRNAFINWDTTAADKYAALLQTALISVLTSSLKMKKQQQKLQHCSKCCRWFANFDQY
jgi:hypothetical protein